jgi:hypothetical protein
MSDMTSVSSVNVNLNVSVATQQVSGGAGGGGHHHMRKAGMDAAAKALGMSSDDLKSELKSGKSLKDIASAQGVDLSKVQSAIKDATQNASGADGAPQGHHHGGGMKKVVDAAAQALDMDPKDLVNQIENGKTLQDIASSKGVDFSKVQSAVKDAAGSTQQSGYSAAGTATSTTNTGALVNTTA